MPGYSVEPTIESNFIYADEANLDNIQNKAFVGFRLDNLTGNLTVEIIDDDELIISIPDELIVSKNDYKQFFWTKKNLNFDWNSQRPGHLIMEVF